MMKTAILFAFAFVALASALSIKFPPHGPLGVLDPDMAPIVNEKMIQEINDMQTTWKAGVNERLKGVSRKDFIKLLGTKVGGERLPEKDIVVGDVPTAFDARTQWPTCIGPVLDQGHCGSCWAFGAVESLQDRLCIQSNGTIKVALAPQDLVSCDETNNGCDGGEPGSAWNYLKKTGVVTESCYPYAMGACHHPGCSEWPTPKCNKTCNDATKFPADKHFAKSSYSIAANVDKIATEILTHGPVEGTFAVYEDFANYVSGVYAHKTGSLLGYHAIKIIGWGVQGDVKYWIVQNSWNPTWGIEGFFWIQAGTDESGIEDGITAGLAKTA